MLHLAWQSVRGNVGRYVATLVAIVTGVAFFAATGFVGQGVIDSLEGDVDRQYGAVDVAVVPDVDALSSGSAVQELKIPAAVADDIGGVDGVDAVAGILTGPVAFLGDDQKPFANGATGRLWITDEDLNPVAVVEGAAPEAADEIAVDHGLAESEDLAVGDDVVLLSVAGATEVTIVGITEFGDQDAIDPGGTVSIPEASAFDVLNDGLAEYETLYLRGSGDATALADAVAAEVPDGFVDQTGEQFRADQRAQSSGFANVFKQALQGFALLALLVGGFVIYNTFSVIVAQRLRELAVLAAIGATPKQIKRSLRIEGLVIGLLGSAIGVVVGIGLAFLLGIVLGALGIGLAGGSFVVSPPTIVQGVVIGTLITFLSVNIPARRAARTEPIEALRDAAVEAPSVTRSRLITTAVLVGLGLVLLLAGPVAASVGIGALLLAVGVIVAGPIIATGGAAALRVLVRPFGLEARLAVDNVARNPQRTATTANALLIGVFLVTLVTVAGSSARDFALAEIGKVQSADYVVSSQGGTIDDGLVSSLEAVEDVEAVTPFRRETVTLDGEPSVVSTGDVDSLLAITDLDVEEGDLDALADGGIAVIPTDPSDVPELGSTVTVASTTGASADVEVVAVLSGPIDGLQIGNLVDVSTFDGLVGDTAPTVAFIDVTDGAETDTEDAIDAITEQRPDIAVTAGNALGKLISQVFDFLINAINGLLMMSVVVALVGIVNTLSLSILERRRELGLLRVVGMTDRRVRRMVRAESVLISVIGTVSGLALGLVIGFGVVFAIDRLADADIRFNPSVPYLVVVLVLGVVLGLLASLIPSSRSTKLEALEAIQST